MNGICPCCGNEMPINQSTVFSVESHTLVSSTYAVTFSKNEALVFELLWKNRNTGSITTKDQIFDHLYALDPNGGPESKIVDVMINHVRRRIVQTDLEIVTVWAKGYFLRERKTGGAPHVKPISRDALTVV